MSNDYAKYHVFGFNPENQGESEDSSYYKSTSEVLIVNTFTVLSKRTGISYEVFAVKDAHFLIFFDGSFTWQPMNNFRPNKTTEQERIEKESPKNLMFKSQKKKEQVLYP